MEPPVVILPNGAGSVGKSSVAQSMQRIAARPLLRVAMDAFLDMVPARMFGDPDGLIFRPVRDMPDPTLAIETGPLARQVLVAMRQTVATLAGQVCSLVVDEVLLHGDAEYKRLLRGMNLRVVGLFAPLEALEARERARSDREIGLARWQCDRVHRGVAYDLELDTAAASSDDIARSICTACGL